MFLLKIFLLTFTSLKSHGNLKNDQFLVETSKTSSEILSAAIATAFSTKFVLDAKVQKSAFLKYIKFRSLIQLSCPKYQF